MIFCQHSPVFDVLTTVCTERRCVQKSEGLLCEDVTIQMRGGINGPMQDFMFSLTVTRRTQLKKQW